MELLPRTEKRTLTETMTDYDWNLFTNAEEKQEVF